MITYERRGVVDTEMLPNVVLIFGLHEQFGCSLGVGGAVI